MSDSNSEAPEPKPVEPEHHEHSDRINAVEIGIFTAVTATFLYSLYSLFFTSIPTTEDMLRNRQISLVDTANLLVRDSAAEKTVELSCNDRKAASQTLNADRIRLTGEYCFKGRSLASVSDSAPGIKTSRIYNEANGMAATILSDPETKKFTTDYIPLKSGKNNLIIEFIYSNGDVYKSTFEILNEK